MICQPEEIIESIARSMVRCEWESCIDPEAPECTCLRVRPPWAGGHDFAVAMYRHDREDVPGIMVEILRDGPIKAQMWVSAGGGTDSDFDAGHAELEACTSEPQKMEGPVDFRWLVRPTVDDFAAVTVVYEFIRTWFQPERVLGIN